MLIFLCERDSQRCPQGGAERSARRIRLTEEYRAWPKRPSAPLDRRTEKYAARPLPENPALGGIPSRGGDVRRTTSDEQRATSNEQRATSNERRAKLLGRLVRVHQRDDPLEVVDRGELDGDASLGLPEVDLHPGLESIGQPVGQIDQPRSDRLVAPASGRGVVTVHVAEGNDLFDRTHRQALGNDPL